MAFALIVFGELLRLLLHFTVGSLSIAGGVILLVLPIELVLGKPDLVSTWAQRRTRCNLPSSG